MFYEIVPSKNHKYDSVVIDTLKEYDKFFGVSYGKENFTFIITKDLEQYRNVTNIKASYAVANTISDQQMVFVTNHNAIKFKCSTDNEYNNLLRHELAHIYMGKYIWYNWCLPVSFSEGFATFISNQIKDLNCNENIYTLFDKNVSSKVFYTGGGFFIEYLINTYKKEKFLKFLELNRKTNTKDDWKKHFKKVYKKTHNEILNEMLKCNSFLVGNYSLSNFKKFINELVSTCKNTFSKTLKINFDNEINFKIISSKNEMKKQYKIITGKEANWLIPTLYDHKRNVIYFYSLNPYKTYFRKQEYIGNISYQCYLQMIFSHYIKGKKQILPNWLICGIARYFAFKPKEEVRGNVTTKIFNNKIVDTKECALFIKYIIETYKKEKLIKFFKSLESITSKKQVEENFKTIYNKGFKEIFKEI